MVTVASFVLLRTRLFPLRNASASARASRRADLVEALGRLVARQPPWAARPRGRRRGRLGAGQRVRRQHGEPVVDPVHARRRALVVAQHAPVAVDGVAGVPAARVAKHGHQPGQPSPARDRAVVDPQVGVAVEDQEALAEQRARRPERPRRAASSGSRSCRDREPKRPSPSPPRSPRPGSRRRSRPAPRRARPGAAGATGTAARPPRAALGVSRTAAEARAQPAGEDADRRAGAARWPSPPVTPASGPLRARPGWTRR